MLSVKPIENAQRASHYFLEKDDYYLQSDGERKIVWYGKGAEKLGLKGEVSKQIFTKLLQGILPISSILSDGQKLGRYRNGERQHRAGYDLTFSPPKSVSILSEVLLYDQEEKQRAIHMAHKKAVKKTLDLIEERCAQARVFINGTKEKYLEGKCLGERNLEKKRFGEKRERSSENVLRRSDFVDTKNIVAALVQHNVSRELDPQLHTHCVIMNATERPDGKWRALARQDIKRRIHSESNGFLERVYTNQRDFGAIYRSYLAVNLKGQGYELIRAPHKDCRFEIKGIPQELIEEFSKRRKDIEEKLKKEDQLDDAKAASIATLKTRKSKQNINREFLRDSWDKTINELGHSKHEILKETIKEELNKEIGMEWEKDERSAEKVVSLSIKSLAEREACFAHSSLEILVLDILIGGINLEKTNEIIDKFVKEGKLIPASLNKEYVSVRETNGVWRTVEIDKTERAWTTPEALALERESIKIVKDGQDKFSSIFSSSKKGKEYLFSTLFRPELFSSEEMISFFGGFELTKGQERALEGIFTTRDQIIGIQGFPGVGKTTMMKVAKILAEKQGYRIIGVAPSAAAARKLETESGISAQTISSYLVIAEKSKNRLNKLSGLGREEKSKKEENEKEEQQENIQGKTQEEALGKINKILEEKREKVGDKKTILLVDESSMASATQLNKLLNIIKENGMRGIISGDRKQLGAVEWGRPFWQLQLHGMHTITMKDIIRQNEGSALKEAVMATIKEKLDIALDKLGENLYEIKGKNKRLDEIAKHYLSYSPEERRDVRIGVGKREDRSKLNDLIRQRLRDEGTICKKAVSICILEPRDLTQAEKCIVEYYEPTKDGETIVRFNRKYKSLGIEKGKYYKVIGLDARNNVISLRRANGFKKAMEKREKTDKHKDIMWNPIEVGGRRRGAIEVFDERKQSISKGERIRFTRNDKELGVVNSETGKVIDVKQSKTRTEVLVCLDHGQSEAKRGILSRVFGLGKSNAKGSKKAKDEKEAERIKKTEGIKKVKEEMITLRLDQKNNQHWDYAYASTIHALQGDTCSEILLEQDSRNLNLTNLKSFLVGISRAKYHSYVYTNDKVELQDRLLRNKGDKTSAIEGVSEKEKQENRKEQSEQNKQKRQGNWDINVIHERLINRTEDIARKLLGEPDKKMRNEWRYGSKKGSFVLTISGEKRGFWYDFQTGEGGNLLKLIQQKTGGDFKDTLDRAAKLVGLLDSDKIIEFISTKRSIQEKEDHRKYLKKRENKERELTDYQKKQIEKVRDCEKESIPINGTLAERYLIEHRGIHCKLPQSLRFHPQIYNSETKKKHPVLIGFVKDKKGSTIAMQVTYLDKRTANKVEGLEVKKRTIGPAGGTMGIDLNDRREDHNIGRKRQKGREFMVIAEGIETALSIKEVKPNLDVYSTLGVANFKEFPVEKHQTLIICADNDGIGSVTEKTLKKTSERLTEHGIKHVIIKPQKEGYDFNDVLRNDGKKAIEREVNIDEIHTNIKLEYAIEKQKIMLIQQMDKTENIEKTMDKFIENQLTLER